MITLVDDEVTAETAHNITALELAKVINTLTNLYFKKAFKITEKTDKDNEFK
ncbi:hypothetical protein [Parapedobacter sp. 2B3]|uniref:hypothetical protein n=1 Tax=Parapedobacter sp. 2B3 TaxID=3342381 RepID=UPI0035B65A0B